VIRDGLVAALRRLVAILQTLDRCNMLPDSFDSCRERAIMSTRNLVFPHDEDPQRNLS
jgi:hypothetical protein